MIKPYDFSISPGNISNNKNFNKSLLKTDTMAKKETNQMEKKV